MDLKTPASDTLSQALLRQYERGLEFAIRHKVSISDDGAYTAEAIEEQAGRWREIIDATKAAEDYHSGNVSP